MTFPLDKHIVDSICRQFGLRNFNELGTASIRQLAGVVRNIEQATGLVVTWGWGKWGNKVCGCVSMLFWR